MKQECFNKNVKVKVAILITIILSIFASGCIEPTFEIKNFACQEFIIEKIRKKSVKISKIIWI